MPAIGRLHVLGYDLPLAPPVTLGGRIHRTSPGLILVIEDDRGFSGLGEIPLLFGWPGGDREAFWSQVLRLEHDLPGELLPDEIGPWDDPAHRLPGLPGLHPMVRAGLEQAILYLLAEAHGVMPLDFLSIDPAIAPSALIPVTALLEGTGEDPVEAAVRLAEEGFTTFKLKVGRGDPRRDLDRIRRLRQVLGPVIRLRLDANRAWDFQTAVDFGREAAPGDVEFLEEPLADPAGIPGLAAATGIPIALDESLIGIEPSSFAPPEGVSHLVLKTAFLGGAATTLGWIRRARALGLSPVVSAVFPSAVGWSLDALLAASLGPGAPAAGLGTCRFLAADLASLRPEMGSFAVSRIPWRRGDFDLPGRTGPVDLGGTPRARERPFFLSESAARHPAAPALEAQDRRIAYGELDALVQRSAWALLSENLLPGNRVAFWMPPSADLAILLLACWRAGLTAVLLDPRLPPPAVEERLALAPVRLLVSAGGVIPGSERTLSPARLAADLIAPAGRPAPLRRPPPGIPATVIFTSGSSGLPKAAVHTLGNHLASAAGFLEVFPLAPGDRWLLALPLHHVGGLSILFRCILAGAAAVIPESGASLAESVDRAGVTHVSLVATQLARLLRERHDLPGVKLILLGGGAIPPALVEEAVGRGWPVSVGYGMTEMSSTVTATRLGDPAEGLRTSGRALPGRHLAISADGEILVAGEMLFEGYLVDGRSESPLDVDGWFATGDIGDVDQAGNLVVRGRKDAMFVSGGENVHPEAIERELASLPGVAEAVVVPLDDAEFGQRPAAFVRMSDGSEPDRESLRAALRTRLPGFMVPVRVFPLPASVGLKPDRARLARLASDGV